MKVALLIALTGLFGCKSTSKARTLLAEGDWGGARNVLLEARAGESDSVQDRGLLLFAQTVADAQSGGLSLQKACALDPAATSYLLSPGPDDTAILDRRRNDLRRTLKDQQVQTESAEDYSAVLHEAVRYALHDQPWKPEHALAKGAYGLCAVWMGMDGGESVLIDSLRSKNALEHGASAWIALAGDRIVEPLRAVAQNPDDVASGPAADALRELLEPGVVRSVLLSVQNPLDPAAHLRALSTVEGVSIPSVRSARPTRANSAAGNTARGWFGLPTGDQGGLATTAWAASSFDVNQRPVRIFWTWDATSAISRVYGLVWSGASWDRITFDGQDPWTDSVAVALSVRPSERGFDVVTFTGIGEESMVTKTWAGPTHSVSRRATTETLRFDLNGSAATRQATVEAQ